MENTNLEHGSALGNIEQSILAPDIVWILVGDEEIKVETLDDMLPNRFILNKFRDWRNE